MVDKILVDILTNTGLSQKEAKVYLSLTEIGTSVVSQIAKGAGLNRVSTYDILEKLKSRGLVSFFTKQKTKYFTAIQPETLLQEQEKVTNDLRAVLPKLKNLAGEISHPRVRYFEGLEGIKAVYLDSLNSSTEILNYCNSKEVRASWPQYEKEYIAQRAKKKIFLRGISPVDQYAKKLKQDDQKFHREIRLLPGNQFLFTNEINIYDDKVAILSFKKELIGMIIESSEIANSQRAIFEMCWQLAGFKNLATLNTRIKEPSPKKSDPDNMSLF